MTQKEAYSSVTLPYGSHVFLLVAGQERNADAKRINAPAVEGLTQASALRVLREAGIEARVIYDPHPTVRKGRIVASLPSGGSEMGVCDELLLLISAGKPRVAPEHIDVPDVVGLSAQEATNVITQRGLKPEIVASSIADSDIDVVVVQVPQPPHLSAAARRSDIVRWALIALLAAALMVGYFFLGEQGVVPRVPLVSAQTVVVPKVIGLAQEQAKTALTKAGFKVGKSVMQLSATQSAGTIIECRSNGKTLKSGARLSRGSIVVLVVAYASSSSDTIVVPDVVGLKYATAVERMSGAGLVIDIVEQYSNTIAEGLVMSTNPVQGVNVSLGAHVQVVVSKGKQSTDDGSDDATQTAPAKK